MMIDLNKLKAACLSRGDLPDACNGCPANDNNTTGPVYGSDYTSFPRCKLLCPRAWNIDTIEAAAKQLLDHMSNEPAPACSRCRYSKYSDGRLWCHKTRRYTVKPVVVLFGYSCNEFMPMPEHIFETEYMEQAE